MKVSKSKLICRLSFGSIFPIWLKRRHNFTDSNNIVQAVYTDYEPTGKIGQIDYHNGTATKYTYDAWSTKLFGIVTEDPTRDPAKNLQNREYTYSRAGDILRIQDHVQKVTYDYAYDKLHRLVSEKLSSKPRDVHL